MCCFNRPIDHVFSTRIFVGAKGGKQITVYGARIYGARIEMVLPVRTRGAETLEFVDLKAYPDFFLDCERASKIPTRSAGIGPKAAAGALLPVQQVGDYKVSFAPSWKDLDRADPAVFQLSDRLKKVVTEFYPAGQYGFVIYKPDKSGEMHPLAYRHPVRPHESLFVPTRHEHGHEGPPDWDHYVYYQGRGNHIPADTHLTGADTLPHAVFTAAKTAGKPVPPELDLAKPLSRLTRHGTRFPNGDLEIGQG